MSKVQEIPLHQRRYELVKWICQHEPLRNLPVAEETKTEEAAPENAEQQNEQPAQEQTPAAPQKDQPRCIICGRVISECENEEEEPKASKCCKDEGLCTAPACTKKGLMQTQLQNNVDKCEKRRLKALNKFKEEAYAKAQAQVEAERKQLATSILAEYGDRFNPRTGILPPCCCCCSTSCCSSSCCSSECTSCTSECCSCSSECSSVVDDLDEQLEKLKGIAEKVERAGAKIREMAQTSLSPKKCC